MVNLGWPVVLCTSSTFYHLPMGNGAFKQNIEVLTHCRDLIFYLTRQAYAFLSASWVDCKSFYQGLASSGFRWKAQGIHQVLSAWGTQMPALCTDTNTSWNLCVPFQIFCPQVPCTVPVHSSGTVSISETAVCNFRSVFPHFHNPQTLYPPNYVLWCFPTIARSFLLPVWSHPNTQWFG